MHLLQNSSSGLEATTAMLIQLPRTLLHMVSGPHWNGSKHFKIYTLLKVNTQSNASHWAIVICTALNLSCVHPPPTLPSLTSLTRIILSPKLYVDLFSFHISLSLPLSLTLYFPDFSSLSPFLPSSLPSILLLILVFLT